MSFVVPRLGRSTLAALVAGGALSAFAMAPSAEAAFTIKPCTGSSIDGVGATFQNNAHQKAKGWASLFQTTSTAASCPGGPLVRYNGDGVTPTGSGAGRAALGGATDANKGQRNVQFRFAGSDEGPTLDQQQNMNTGILGNSADDGRVHVIPAAASAVAVVVNYPKWDHDGDGGTTTPTPQVSCPVPDGFRQDGVDGGVSADGYDRLRLTNQQLERLWAGEYPTWGDLIPTLAADPAAAGNPGAYTASCVTKPLIRVVRNDSSGTTYAFKDFLNEAVAGLGAGNSSGTAWRTGWMSDNRRWPGTTADNDHTGSELNNDYGEIANASFVCDTADLGAKPICRPGTTGAGALRDVVKANPGSIGYLDLATAVLGDFTKEGTATDATYFLPLAVRNSTSTFVEATFNPEGYKKKSGVTTGGANCREVPVRKLPFASDPTLAFGWDTTTMVWPTAGYSDCTLTYILAFDDNAPVYLSLAGTTYAEEERRARTLKDYLTYVLSDAGQSALVDNDYAPLPKTVASGEVAGTKSAYEAAKIGVDAIDWDKQNIGNQGGGQQPPIDGGNNNNGGGGGAGGGGGTAPIPQAPVVQPPAQQAPVNLFTIGSARKRANDLVGTFRLPGAGALQVTASGTYTEKTKAKKGKKATSRKRTVTVGRATVAVTRAGDLSVKLPMSAKSRSALKKAKRITVKVTAIYTPTGGTARTVTRTLTLRA